MKKTDAAPSHSFSQPIRQIVTMLVVCVLVGLGGWLIKADIEEIMRTNPWLNLFIAGVFALGVLTCFWQVLILMQSVSWIEGFVRETPGHRKRRARRGCWRRSPRCCGRAGPR